jgi:hypothetical protein
MSRSISSNARSQVQFTEMTDVLLVTLDIEHVDLTSTIYLVNNNQDIEYDSNTYSANNFKFTPPTQEGGEVNEAKLTISNIDQALIAALRGINSAPTITANIIFYGDTPVLEAGPWEFYLKDISYNMMSITGTLSYKFNPKMSASTVIMNYNEFPSMLPVVG